ncbi:acyltransferase family protein [Tardiphaga sp. 841_E9_N1_2]|uniref:acyltransferase family protein n=1 Tax=Tardiphaga sp. 841_E9_N1_2 TaxID=3240762 RepID=UPI003F2321FD
MRNFAGIQMMRGLAALSVVVVHAVSVRPGMGFSDATIKGAQFLQMGVDVFFVISGFIIALTASRIGIREGRAGTIDFTIKRVVRIYPIYWVVLFAAVISSRWIAVGPPTLPQELTLDTVFLTTAANWYVTPAWTLYFEVNFYLGVALVLMVFPRYVLEATFAAVCILAFATISPFPRLPGIMSSPLTLEFGFGVAIALLVARCNARGFGLASMFAGGVLLTVGSYEVLARPASEALRVATYGVGAAFLIYGVVVTELKGARFPRSLQYLGNISYSLYVWHLLILTWLSTTVEVLINFVPGPFQIVAWILITIIAASISHEFIEKPTVKAARWISYRKKTDQESTPRAAKAI